MGPLALLAVVAIAALVMSCLGTRLLITALRHGAVLDRPNERSSHVVPTPRGGGIAVIGTVVLIWAGLCAAGLLAPVSLVIPAGAVVLAAVSWVDDLRGLSPALRLVAQCAAVAAAIWTLPGGAVFQGWLPPELDAVAGALAWVWFINLFNFMDGIDGLGASEAAAIGIGMLLFSSFGIGKASGIAPPVVAIAAASLGFLIWNWPPARIFLGDVGSVPLGFLLGFLLRDLAARGWWRVALILPLYFVADASLTLLRRLARGERVWQAHREHFYQRAVRAGLSHAAVVWRVIAANVVLIGCGWAAENGWGFAALSVASLSVAALLVELGRTTR